MQTTPKPATPPVAPVAPPPAVTPGPGQNKKPTADTIAVTPD